MAGGNSHCTRAWTGGASPQNQCWKLYYVRRGSAAVEFASGRQKLVSGHLYFINGYQQTGQICESSMEVDWLHIQISSWRLRLRMEQLPPAVSLPCPAHGWQAENLKKLRELFDQPATAYRNLRGVRPDARPEIYLRVMGLVLGVLSDVLEKFPDHAVAPAGSEQLQPALDYMESHYLENPPLGTLARKVGWQAEYFHRRFRQALGITPFAFIERRRLEEAVQLLTDTAMTVKQVAGQLRFSSPSYFTRVFTRRFGVSPLAFRRQALRRDGTPRLN